MAQATMFPAYLRCETCVEYGTRRAPAIVPLLVEREHEALPHELHTLERRSRQAWFDYMAKVHERHESGLPLHTRSEELIERIARRFEALGIPMGVAA